MAIVDRVFSKNIALTDTTNGHKITSVTIDADTPDNLRFKYLKLVTISTGTIEIKFGLTGDWVAMTAGESFLDLRFNEIWLKPSAANNVDLVVALVAK